MPSVLLTGFDPFGGERLNPSWEAVRRLRGEVIGGHVIAVARVPTRFDACEAALARAMKRHAPRLVICVGQAGGREAISLERVAINVIDARIADNAGARPIDVPVIAGAPLAYASSLPIKSIVAALRRRGVPAEVSNTAGTFVCNALAYALAHRLATTQPGVRGGFIHIPYLPAQVRQRPGVASLPLETIVDALRVAISVAIARRRDARRSEGRTH